MNKEPSNFTLDSDVVLFAFLFVSESVLELFVISVISRVEELLLYNGFFAASSSSSRI